MLIWETWFAICGATRTAGAAAVQFFLADGHRGNYKWGNLPQHWLLFSIAMLHLPALFLYTTQAPGLNILMNFHKFTPQRFLLRLCPRHHTQ
jgi:hypothetical protein